MNYRIQELGSFSIIGQEIELTNFRTKNIQISTLFWKRFNISLKKSYLSQSGNWIKYAFMEKHNRKLIYYCAIPQKVVVPEGFISKRVNPYRYMVVEHIGSMDKVYETYEKIYKKILPNSGYMPLQNEFLHFEKYDYRFHWNSSKSVIEIWISVQSIFKEHIGMSFSFNVQFQKWLKSHTGKTYKNAITAYYEILKEKKDKKSFINKQFEYNTYIRDFFDDNKEKPLEDAIKCWKYKKQLQGHNRYEKSDLIALE